MHIFSNSRLSDNYVRTLVSLIDVLNIFDGSGGDVLESFFGEEGLVRGDYYVRHGDKSA